MVIWTFKKSNLFSSISSKEDYSVYVDALFMYNKTFKIHIIKDLREISSRRYVF